jgi:hypothetical protein
MTGLGRVRRRRRPFLLAGLAIATAWAGYWLWPRAPQRPDFEVRLWDGGGALPASGPLSVAELDPPTFRQGYFYADNGKLVDARSIIRDDRANNIDSPSYSAVFRLDDEGTRADLEAAAKQIWAICDAAIYVPLEGRADVSPLLPPSTGRDCAFLFANRDYKPGTGR